MSYIVVDVESDGPCPGIYSMVSFGAVVVEPTLSRTFYGETKPVTDVFLPEALAISGFSREEHETFNDPQVVMEKFYKWIERNSIGYPIFCSDNLAYDWQFINYYFHKYIGDNPFGHSGLRIGDLYCGMEKTMSVKNEWQKKFRFTKHTHNPVDDAKGNAEAMLAFQGLGLDIKLI